MSNGMRVLVITNYYSPCRYGWGYRQLCEEVTDGLAARGHAVAVLTSTELHGAETPRPYPVYRRLQIEPDWENGRFAPAQFFIGRRRREAAAVETVRALMRDFRPDVIFVWHAVGIPRAVFQEAERLLPGRVAYYLADYQPELADEYIAYWSGEPANPLARLIKKPAAALALAMLRREGKPLPLRYEHVACVSGYVRDRLAAQELITPHAVVIHNGVDLQEFAANGSLPNGRLANGRWAQDFTAAPIRCLVAGRLVAEKGIHTVVDGFGRVQAQRPGHPLRLTILGSGPDDYVAMLRQQVTAHGLQEVVTFQSPVPREQMPRLLAQHDVMIVPSEYDEPLARAMQEGMAMGLLVVGTTTGGSGELLRHDETGLVFAPGDGAALAAQLLRIVDQPALARRLAQTGCDVVIDHFNIPRMIAEVEDFLSGIVSAREVMR